MLRKFITGASALIIALSLTTGCSKKKLVASPADPNDPRDKGTPTAPKTPTPPAASKPAFEVSFDNIQGNWHLVGMVHNGQTEETPVDEYISHIFTFTAEYDEFRMSYQTLYNGGSSDTGWWSLNGTDFIVNWDGGGTTSAYGVTMTSDDDLILPDSNPEISTIKSRHYKRISDENRDYMFSAYGVK